MAQQYYTWDVTESDYPLLSEQAARTLTGTEPGREYSSKLKPAVLYMHNVMPTDYGLKSVGYTSVANAAELPVGRKLIDVRHIYGSNSNRLYMAWDNYGKAYVLVPGNSNWIAIPTPVAVTESASFVAGDITIGSVNGVSYIYYKFIGCYTYDEVTQTLVSAPFTELVESEILGVVASSGYLLAYTKKALAWSSTIVPTDFTPSAVTGAGGGNIADISGNILFCSANTLGVLIFSDTNTIAGTYTGNTQYPFKFREVDNSKGGLSASSVSYEANTATQYVYSKAGIQAISSSKAETVLPKVTDFLAGKRFEDFNESTLQLEVTTLSTTMNKKIKYIAARYLIVSYGITEFTHVLVWDTALNRVGKLKITHTDIFEYIGNQQEVSKESFACLLSTGEVKVLDFSRASSNSSGVVIFGKMQATRTRGCQINEVSFENVGEGADFVCGVYNSYDGKNTNYVEGILDATSTGDLRRYFFRVSGKNHSILCKGKFDLTNLEVVFVLAGRK